jgi:hypothetical protein
LVGDFENCTVFKAGDHHRLELNTLPDEAVAWSTALASLRNPSPHTAAA